MESLVSVQWLAAHLRDPNVVVLDASLPLVGVQPVIDVRSRYAELHIPGAVFFDIEELSEKATILPHMLPTPEAFSEHMSALGVGGSMTMVVYEQGGVFAAPRARWMLRTMGATDVRVLDGGLGAWVRAGCTTEAGEVSRPRSAFRAVLNHEAVRQLTHLLTAVQALGPHEQVLDARSACRFAGTAPEPRAGISSGHMPGSINVPYMELVAGEVMKEPALLRTIFESHGVDLTKPITTSCGSGITAAVLALGLELCGVHDVRLYDGSWAEYASRPDAVIFRS